jgi:hypothetical protein
MSGGEVVYFMLHGKDAEHDCHVRHVDAWPRFPRRIIEDDKTWMIWRCDECGQDWHVNSKRAVRVRPDDVQRLKASLMGCDVAGNFTPRPPRPNRPDPPDPGKGFTEYGPRKRWWRK